MKHLFKIFLSLVFIFITSTATAQQPNNSVYTDGGDSKIALILAHGRGKYPTWKVVEPLRLAVSDELGYHTLSLQLPNEDKHWESYAEDFPVAYKMFKQAIQFLQNEKGITKIYLMGHSMGSRMASAFVAKFPTQKIDGLIIAGCRNNGDEPLSCLENMQKVKVATLDIWGGDNTKDIDAASEREGLISTSYRQIEITDANHKFDGADEAFVAAVIKWLQKQK